jgi:outer membrane protein W
MFSRAQTTLAIVLVLGIALPSIVVAGDSPWRVRFGGLWAEPDLQFSETDDNGNRLGLASDGGFGVGLSFEGRLWRRLGVEFGVIRADSEIMLEVRPPGEDADTSTDALEFMPITAGFNFHFTPGMKADVYLGAAVAYIPYSNLVFTFQTEESRESFSYATESDLGYMAQVGVDYGKEKWMLNFVLRYLDTTVRVIAPSGTADIAFDPWIFQLGFGYRF